MEHGKDSITALISEVPRNLHLQRLKNFFVASQLLDYPRLISVMHLCTDLPMLGPLLKLSSNCRTLSRIFFRRPEEGYPSSPRSWFSKLMQHLSSSFRALDYSLNRSRMTCWPFLFPSLLRTFPHLLNVQLHLFTTSFFHCPHNFLTVLAIFFVTLGQIVNLIINIQ